MTSKINQALTELDGFIAEKEPFSNRIIHGECLSTVQTIQNRTVDIVITILPGYYSDVQKLAELLSVKVRVGRLLYIFVQNSIVKNGRIPYTYLDRVLSVFVCSGMTLKFCSLLEFEQKRLSKYLYCLKFCNKKLSDKRVKIYHPESTIRVKYTGEFNIPVGVYSEILSKYSDVLVLDPFAGSANVVEACMSTGNRYLAIEADEEKVKKLQEIAKQVNIFEKRFQMEILL